MRFRIQLINFDADPDFYLIRMRIQVTKTMRIQIHNTATRTWYVVNIKMVNWSSAAATVLQSQPFYLVSSQSSPPPATALLFCMQKSSGRTYANGINRKRKRVQKEFNIIFPFWIRKVSLAKPLVLLILPLNPQPLCESEDGEKEERERGESPCPLPIKCECILHRRGRKGGGDVDGGSFTLCLYMSQVMHKQCDNTNNPFFQWTWRKNESWHAAIWTREVAENPMMSRRGSSVASEQRWPTHSNPPPPPPSPRTPPPFMRPCGLSPSCCLSHTWFYRGVS